MKKWATVLAAIIIGVMLSASSCKGKVITREWVDQPIGKDTCHLRIEPYTDDDGDKEPNYTVRNASNRTCNNCPVGAEYPTCKNADEKKNAIINVWRAR